MSSQPAAHRVVRFGLFELDVPAGELRRQGRRIKLQDQPLQVLELLLGRPGEVVTREELQKALWPPSRKSAGHWAIRRTIRALPSRAQRPQEVTPPTLRGWRRLIWIAAAITALLEAVAIFHRQVSDQRPNSILERAATVGSGYFDRRYVRCSLRWMA